MAKFAIGQRVEIAFNPQTPDPRVPDQINGRYAGRGDYQTKANQGEILEVRDTEGGAFYLVAVELEAHHVQPTGKTIVVKSQANRVIPEAKLTAI